MSGETTDYLGIILAVAGLFFLVVISSICMSCFKCCQKQIVRRASRRAPPHPVKQPQPVPAPAASSSYGSTVRKPSILVDRAARKAAGGSTCERLRRVSEGLSPQNIRKAFSPKRQRVASEGPPTKVEQVTTQNKQKIVKYKSQESASQSGDYRIYNIESGSTPELKCSPSKDSLKKRGLFFSFDSFSAQEYETSSGEKGYYSSGSQDGSQWMTPEDDHAILDSFSRDRTKSSG